MKKWEETYAEGKENFLKYGYPDDDDMFSSRSRKYYKRAYIMLFLGKLAKLPENKLGTFSGMNSEQDKKTLSYTVFKLSVYCY